MLYKGYPTVVALRKPVWEQIMRGESIERAVLKVKGGGRDVSLFGQHIGDQGATILSQIRTPRVPHRPAPDLDCPPDLYCQPHRPAKLGQGLGFSGLGFQVPWLRSSVCGLRFRGVRYRRDISLFGQHIGDQGATILSQVCTPRVPHGPAPDLYCPPDLG